MQPSDTENLTEDPPRGAPASDDPVEPAARDCGALEEPSPQDLPPAPWPSSTEQVERHGTLIRLTGPFSDEDRRELQRTLHGRPVTLADRALTIWPSGAGRAQSFDSGLIILHGVFNELDLKAVRAAYPARLVTCSARHVITVWPPADIVAEEVLQA